MAAWQARLSLIPIETIGQTLDTWPRLAELQQALDHLFQGAPTPLYDGSTLHWGSFETDDAHLHLEDEELALVIRLDLRKPWGHFVSEIVKQLARFDMQIGVRSEWLPLSESTMTEFITQSRAFLYVHNPKAWFRT